MPAYYTVAFQFERAALRPDFLQTVYLTLLQGDFAYEGVLAWGCQDNLSLEEGTQWNQERLDRDFELGYTEDVSNDYRQILLHHPRYRECRVILHNSSGMIGIIVPEDDIFAVGEGLPAELFAADHEELTTHIRQDQVNPLKQLAIAVWERGLIVSVQTYAELGIATSYKLLQKGKAPSLLPFAIVDVTWVGTGHLPKRGIRISKLGDTGVLLEQTKEDS